MTSKEQKLSIDNSILRQSVRDLQAKIKVLEEKLAAMSEKTEAVKAAPVKKAEPKKKASKK